LLKKIIIGKHVKNVIVISNSDTINLSIILAIRSISKTLPIIARCNSYKTKKKLKLAGANEVMHINEAATLEALGYVGSPIAFEAIDEILIDQKGALMDVIEVFENSNFIGKTLDLIKHEQFNINLIGIYRDNNFIFNPKKENFKVLKKDMLVVIGYEKSIDRFKTYIQSYNISLFGKVE